MTAAIQQELLDLVQLNMTHEQHLQQDMQQHMQEQQQQKRRSWAAARATESDDDDDNDEDNVVEVKAAALQVCPCVCSARWLQLILASTGPNKPLLLAEVDG